MEIEKIVQSQRSFFNCRSTFDITYRKNALLKLQMSIENNYEELIQAFKRDFNKCEFDVVSTELMLVMQELKFMIKHLSKFSRIKKVHTSMINFPSRGEIVPEPFGVTLIVSPWNYPFQLAMIPLIGAIGAGNCVVLKPSNSSPNVSSCIKKILSIFDESYICVVSGDREANKSLFDQKFDFAFFTGGTYTAKILMEKLSKNLTPAILELGGKSPCIIDSDANIEMAARRVVWGKFLNAGQTCVAPDYFLVHKLIKDKFVDAVVENIKNHYYKDGKLIEDFPYIISNNQLEKVLSYIDKKKVVFGGNNIERCLEPTVMNNVEFDDKIMQQEIFGPIMPIIGFDSLETEVERFKEKERPLALYYFGKSRARQNFVMKNLIFGGGCTNDTIMHVSEEKLPFGGVGYSGMGNYHGKKSFDAFTHFKSVLRKSPKFEVRMKYTPYTDGKMKIMKWLSGIK